MRGRLSLALLLALANLPAAAQNAKLEALKKEAIAEVEKLSVMSQQMVDQVFSFGELGFQEYETSRYITGILKKNGFAVKEGVAGMPTAWIATWGSGKPVIALGSDIDCIPKASQKPGVGYHDPIIENAPGHGEGHNSGVPLNVTAALAVKRIMEREKIAGTLMLWPGVAEELVAAKAWFVRDGLFKNVDVTLFTHVSNEFKTSWGVPDSSGLVSVEYTFKGESAHSAGAPWRGRSALDAVELMNAGWNYRREHLRLQQRSHYVITQGGDQPNVVPQLASVWYYFRELDFQNIQRLYDIGNKMAQAAALMTDTETSHRILGTAWPQHMNKVVAEVMTENIKTVGMPQWSEADQALAKGIQAELKADLKPLADKVGTLEDPPKEFKGGGSDDIGDISWNVPTITLRYPSNIPNLPGHNWSNAIAMATPIAHKGVTAGAKAQAMTLLDLLMRKELVEKAWTYFRDVQTKDVKYTPFIKDEPPATHLNVAIMEKYRPEMRKYYFDSTKYKTLLEQLGIQYPTVRKTSVAEK